MCALICEVSVIQRSSGAHVSGRCVEIGGTVSAFQAVIQYSKLDQCGFMRRL